MNLNKVIITGRITQDLEQRSLPSGQAVVNFSVATNRAYTTKDGQKQEEVEFHNVVAFGRQAEIICQYLNKGSLVLIEGRLKTRNWDDPNGFKRYKTEIITEKMQLGPRSANTGGGFQTKTASANFNSPAPAQSQPQSQPQVKTAVNEEDIPVIEEDAEPDKNNEPAPSSDSQDNEEIDVSKIPF